MVIFGWVAVIALAAYVGVAAMMYFAQRFLMYFPETIHTTPAAAGLPEAQEVPLTTADGVPVVVWHVPPQDGKPVIIYFHGNGGALKYRVARFRKLITDGIGLVALEYRGYGGLSGNPTEQGLIADAEAAYAFAAAHYPVQQIVVLLLMKDQFRSDERIGKVTAPLLILHGVHDRTVPYAMGEHLFEIANKPKHIVRFLDGGHEDLDANGALDAVGRFLAGDLD
jgi:uncharacterized protein